jgi:Mycobacterium membrane protein.
MKKTKIFLSALVALSILAIMAFPACSEPEKEYTVKYEITGPATTASFIQFSHETGRDQIDNVNIPWEKTMTFTIPKNYVFTASCGAAFREDTETYTAKIYVNGTEKAKSTGTTTVSATYIIYP